jgi:hypothetical protein
MTCQIRFDIYYMSSKTLKRSFWSYFGVLGVFGVFLFFDVFFCVLDIFYLSPFLDDLVFFSNSLIFIKNPK